MQASDLQAGDVLIQGPGQFFWPTAAWVATGHPNPHCMMVSKVILSPVLLQPTIWVIEDSIAGVTEHELTNPLEWYTARRPLCDDAVKRFAVSRYRARIGEPYAYGNLFLVALVDRTGIFDHAPEDPHEGRKWKICSESIAFHYRKSGYDLFPLEADRYTLPYDLLISDRLVTVA
jgi:hypothetical protein